MAVIYGRLSEVEESWLAQSVADREAILERSPEYLQKQWQSALGELVALVRTFGPIGLDWPRTFEVSNPSGDRAAGGTPGSPWVTVLPSPGFARGRVYRLRVDPGASWVDRVDAGDTGIPHDFLGAESTGPLRGHHEDLISVLRLVGLLAEDKANPHAIRDAAGALPRVKAHDLWDRSVRDPVDVRWAEAVRRPAAIGRPGWSPYDQHVTAIDWWIAGRIELAEFLTSQLAWTRIEAGLDSRGRIRTRWTPRSLIELIYLQLLEHVEDRLHFGIGTCERCGGPILRTRLAEPTRNRCHRGCAAVMRKRRQRERDKSGSTIGEQA
jgi:hypothetical protein